MSFESSSVIWKIKRISSMSIFELIKRILRTLELRLFGININYGLIESFNSLDLPILNSSSLNINEYQLSIQKLLIEADSYLAHKWHYFGSEGIIEENINWHFDFINKKTAPKKYAFSINHREFDLVGNIKVTWEKNRHHHLTILSIAFFITKDEKYAREVVDQIKDWIKENPFLIGVNWTHPLENAIRLISWVYCEKFLRGSTYYNELFNNESTFWESVYEHQKFIRKTYSIGSSANNHLIGEMAGLIISSMHWPYFSESKKWLKFSKQKLEKEIVKQSFHSGVNKEMAFSYQVFVFEFYLLAYIETTNHNISFGNIFTNLLFNNARVISEMTKINQCIPRYGDGDEGMAIQLQDLEGDRISWLMEITKSFYPDSSFNFKSKTLPAVLLGYSTSEPEEIIMDSIGYEDAGLFVINQSLQGMVVSCLFKAGQFGYGSIAAHSHADSLSFTLYVNGIPFFIDPGTFCYHTDLAYRQYFRSTKAHNTLGINNTDQSEQLGPFLWGKKAKTYVKSFSKAKNLIQAYHTGYKNIHAIHSREIELSDQLIIRDEITGKGHFLLDFRFHLHPDVQVLDKTQEKVRIKNKNIEIVISQEFDYKLHAFSGSEEGGWYSPQFNVKVPTTTFSYQKRISLPTKQIFSIDFKNNTK